MMTEFLSKARILKCLFSELPFYVFGRCIVIQFGVNWGASPVPLSSLTNSMLCYCMFCTSLNNQSCLYVNELWQIKLNKLNKANAAPSIWKNNKHHVSVHIQGIHFALSFGK
jgi:hypothetical protein